MMDTTKSISSSRTKSSNNARCHAYISHSSIPSVVKNQQTNATYDHDLNGVFTDAGIFSSPALPLGLPVYLPESIINGIDPLGELIDKKRKWTMVRNKLIAANSGKPVYNSHIVNEGLTSLPIRLVKLAEHVNRDPDPYFSGKYNWYYTDGNLKIVSGDNFNLLASSRLSIPGIVVVQVISSNDRNSDTLCLTGSEISLHSGSTQPILQIASCDNIVASRQKNSASLFSIKSDDGLSSKQCHKCESTTSLTSVSIAPSGALDGEYCTLAAPNELKVWLPCSKNSTRAEGVIKEFSSSDNWGNVKYVSENTILLANRDLVCLKDLRYKINKKNGRTWMKKHVYTCEDICNTVLSRQPNNKCYVATTHQLLELDFRKSYSKSWTHMMHFPPALGFSIQSKDADEIVALGSQNPDEVCCVLTSGNSIPYHLPSPNDTLHKCRLKGICLDPSLTSRCNLSVSGLDSYCYDDKLFMIRQTCIGDTFFQKINMLRDFYETEIDFRELQSWEKQCLQKYDTISSTALAVSNEINYGTQFNSIVERNLRGKTTVRGKLPERTAWNMSKKKMLKLKGSFLECILDAWEIEDEPEWYNPKSYYIKKNATITSEEPGTKVSGWLNDMLGLPEDALITGNEIPLTDQLMDELL